MVPRRRREDLGYWERMEGSSSQIEERVEFRVRGEVGVEVEVEERERERGVNGGGVRDMVGGGGGLVMDDG